MVQRRGTRIYYWRLICNTQPLAKCLVHKILSLAFAAVLKSLDLTREGIKAGFRFLVMTHEAQRASNPGSVSLIPNGGVHKRYHKMATSSAFYKNIQSDSRRKVNIFGGDSTDNCEKKVHISIRLILNGLRDRVSF